MRILNGSSSEQPANERRWTAFLSWFGLCRLWDDGDLGEARPSVVPGSEAWASPPGEGVRNVDSQAHRSPTESESAFKNTFIYFKLILFYFLNIQL